MCQHPACAAETWIRSKDCDVTIADHMGSRDAFPIPFPSFIYAVMIRTTKIVATNLLTNSALLLPEIYENFCSHLTTLITSHQINCDNVDIRQLIRARWILSNLTANLQHHISYSCTTRKFGTLIYSQI